MKTKDILAMAEKLVATYKTNFRKEFFDVNFYTILANVRQLNFTTIQKTIKMRFQNSILFFNLFSLLFMHRGRIHR
jgi:hypothetical protein